MAIQFTDFSKAPLQGSPLSGLFESVLKGYQMQQEPGKMKQEASARELANQLKKTELEHKPKEYELNDKQKELANAMSEKANAHYEEKFGLDRDLKKAQIQKALQKSVGGSPKANGELANYIVSHPNASQEEVRQAYEEIHGRKAEHEETIIAGNKDKVAGNAFDKQPINDKKQSVALMQGMGVDPVEAVRYLRKPNSSPSAYAKEHNIDITQVQPNYPSGEQNIKIAQQAAAYMDELDSLEGHITPALGKYGNKIKGYSLQQIADASKNEDPETQGMVLAGRALLPELSALRGKIAGANIGIEFLKEMEQKSLGTLNVFESLVSPEAYKSAQKYMNQWIREAGQARNKSLIGNSMLKSRLQKGAEAESKKDKILNLSTGKWEEE